MEKKIVHYNKKNIFIDTDVSKRYIELTLKKNKIEKELKAIEKNLLPELKITMEKLDKKEVVSNGIVAKIKSEYIMTRFDTNRFKEEKANIYKNYLKQVKVESKISIDIEK